MPKSGSASTGLGGTKSPAYESKRANKCHYAKGGGLWKPRRILRSLHPATPSWLWLIYEDIFVTSVVGLDDGVSTPFSLYQFDVAIAEMGGTVDESVRRGGALVFNDDTLDACWSGSLFASNQLHDGEGFSNTLCSYPT
jgi:hypothetical protein